MVELTLTKKGKRLAIGHQEAASHPFIKIDNLNLGNGPCKVCSITRRLTDLYTMPQRKQLKWKRAKKKIACSIEYSGVVTLRCTDSTSTRLISVSETGTDAFTCVWPQT